MSAKDSKPAPRKDETPQFESASYVLLADGRTGIVQSQSDDTVVVRVDHEDVEFSAHDLTPTPGRVG